jgi:hypothetical protein
VPGLKKNLLSVGKFAEASHLTLFGPRKCWIFKSGIPKHILLTGTRTGRNSLYKLNTTFPTRGVIQQRPSTNLTISNLTKPELWHHQTGYLNYRSLHHLSRTNMVFGMPVLPRVTPPCQACILGKHHRSVIPKKSLTPTTRPLELIHSDLCGPLPTASLTGSRYILTFIDDFSRRSWVYFLKRKDETLGIFQQYKKIVENETQTTISCLCTDRGGEYTSSEFQAYLKAHGYVVN